MLTINKIAHPTGEPLIATDEFYIIKWVRFYSRMHEYSTIFPSNINLCDKQLPKIDLVTIDDKVYEGYHGYWFMLNIPYSFNKESDQIIPKIFKVPKGTKYYIGKYGDIVAENIINARLEIYALHKPMRIYDEQNGIQNIYHIDNDEYDCDPYYFFKSNDIDSLFPDLVKEHLAFMPNLILA